MSVFINLTIFITYITIILGCRPVCKMVVLSDIFIPTSYQDCICTSDDALNETMNKCGTNEYRSLIFRYRFNGHIAVSRAVIAACVDEHRVHSIDQNIYDRALEQFTVEQRRMSVIERLENAYSTWLFGFRFHLIEYYRSRSHDLQLRFG